MAARLALHRKIIAGLLASMTLLVAAGCSHVGTENVRTSSGGSGIVAGSDPTSLNAAPVPAGTTAVLDGIGNVRGYVPTKDLHQVGFPALALGSGRYQAYGLQVDDANGSAVGYTVEGIGFIDLSTADNPSSFDAAMAAYLKFVNDHAAQTDQQNSNLVTHTSSAQPN